MAKPSKFAITRASQILDNLPMIVMAIRETRVISLRDAADEIGISATTLCKFENDGNVNSNVLRKLLAWAAHNGV